MGGIKQSVRKTEILIYCNGRYEQEQICAEKWLRLIYENPIGRASLLSLVSRKFLSRIYGRYCRTSLSARKIQQFIIENKVNMTGCTGRYNSFSDFFTREKSGILFPSEESILGSPAEGAVSIHTGIDSSELIAAKGSSFSLADLLCNESLAKEYECGIMVRIRLTPADYHRVHFFDNGTIRAAKQIDGRLFSVSPLAVAGIVRLYCRNKRTVLHFDSEHFGEVVLVEVGATFVGSIIHCFENGETVSRGQQCSYFMPGGSLLLAFFKKGAFVPDESILAQSSLGYETKIEVGDALGARSLGQKSECSDFERVF